MNACRTSYVFMPCRSHFESPEKAFFQRSPAGIHKFLCPLGLTADALEGFFKRMPSGIHGFLMPFKTRVECL